MENSFSGKSILVTGGTGAFGQKFLNYLSEFSPSRVVLLSRDEMKHAAIKRNEAFKELDWIDYRIGDVTRRDDVERAMLGVDIVIHAAAMKHLPECEANPAASTLVNVVGTQNVISAFEKSSAKSLVFLSSDKAPCASSVYGAQKYLGEKLITEVASTPGIEKRAFSLRYSNVIDSTGAVFHIFGNLFRAGKTATVNGRETKRGFVTQRQVLSLMNSSLLAAKGGEVFVIKPKVISIAELAEAMQELMGCGEAVVKDTLGAGWEKDSATLVMAEELGLAKNFQDSNGDEFVLIDYLNRNDEASVFQNDTEGSYTLDNCNVITGSELREFLMPVLQDNKFL